MGTTLTGTTPQDTYDSLIKVTDNGPLSGTAKYLSDGLGNDSVLALSTSRVGVGTNAPSYDLTLSKSVAAGNVVLQIENTSTTGSARLWFGNNANAAGARIQYFGATHAQRPNLFSIGTDTANDVMFETSGSERMRITSAGNVGIGTSAPTIKLDVESGIEGITAGFAGATYGVRIDNGGTFSTGASTIHGVNSTLTASYQPLRLNGSYTALCVDNTEVARATANGLTFNGDTAAANALDDYEEGTFTPAIAGSGTAGTATYAAQLGRYTKIGRQVSCQIDLSWSGGTGSGSMRIINLPFNESQVATNPAVTIGFIDGISLTALHYALAYIANGSNRIDLIQAPVGGGSVIDIPYDAEGRIIVNVTYLAS